MFNFLHYKCTLLVCLVYFKCFSLLMIFFLSVYIWVFWLLIVYDVFFFVCMHFKFCSTCTVCYKSTSILLVHIFIAISQSVKVMSQILCKCHRRYVLKFVCKTGNYVQYCCIHIDIVAKLWIPVLLFHIYFFWVYIYLFVWQKGVGREFISIRYNLYWHCYKTLNSSVVIPNLFLCISLILCSFVLFWIWDRENLHFSVSVLEKSASSSIWSVDNKSFFILC